MKSIKKQKVLSTELKNGMMTAVTPVWVSDGFLPSKYIACNCSGIQVTSIGADYDGEVRIEGIIVPKNSLYGSALNELNSFGPKYVSRYGHYEKIIINPPATIVIWKDGTKTVVKATENDIYDPEKGVALCFLKKYFGSSYRQILKDANEIYNKKMEEDVELNNSQLGASLLKGFTASLNEVLNEARNIFLEGQEKEDGGDK